MAHNCRAMLRTEELTQNAPKRGRGRWALLLLVPPIVLLMWALVGINLKIGHFELVTGWRRVMPNEHLGVQSHPMSMQMSGIRIDTWNCMVNAGAGTYVIYYCNWIPTP